MRRIFIKFKIQISTLKEELGKRMNIEHRTSNIEHRKRVDFSEVGILNREWTPMDANEEGEGS